MSDLYPEDLAGMSPREIVEAYRAGRLDAALRGERRPDLEPKPKQSTTGGPVRPFTPLPERR